MNNLKDRIKPEHWLRLFFYMPAPIRQKMPAAGGMISQETGAGAW